MTFSPARTSISLLLSLIIVGCGGGGDSSRNVIENPPPAPQDGISGSVQSRIQGASISVADANGQALTVASGGVTDGGGSFNLVFSEFSINSGIEAPLIITVDASGATATCDFNRDGDNDCLNADGSFVAYGETFTLPDNFALRGIASTFPPETTNDERRITVRISAASDIAAAIALNSGQATLTSEAASEASAQALGLVEFITGLPTRGQEINDINLSDLTQPIIRNSAVMAVGLFAASLHDRVDISRASRSNYRRVLDDLTNNISEGEQLTATGTYLSEAVSNFIVAASSFQSSLPVSSPVLQGAIASQQATAQLLTDLGNGTAVISAPPDPDSDEPLERSKTLVNRLTEAIGATLLLSTTDNFGGTPTGAATVYADQVSLLTTLASSEVRGALIVLDDALAQALIDGETQLTGTNVSGVLEFDGDTVNITTATATTTNIQTGVSVNISMQNGSRTNPGGDGEYVINNITIGVTQTQNNITSQELFEGSLDLTMVADGASADATAMAYSGTIRAQSGLEFSGTLAISDISGVNTSPIDATYDADFSFTGQSTLNMKGKLESGIRTYTVGTLSSNVLVDLVTRVISDFSTQLNLSTDETGTVVTGGTLTSQGIETGSMDADGVIQFDDGTTAVLPAPII